MMRLRRRLFRVFAATAIVLYGLGIYSNLAGVLSFRPSDEVILTAIDKHPGCNSTLDSFTHGPYTVALSSVVCPDTSSRDAVFFVHGSPSSLDAFTVYLERKDLVQHADLYAYDRPGFGETSPEKVLMHLDEQSELLATLVRRVDAARNIYVGHSLGCSIIARLAADYPELCDGIVMVAPPIDPDLEPSNWWRPIIDYPSFRIALPRSMIKSNRELLWLKQDLIELEEYWQQIDCPVVLMHGSDDRLVPVENVDYGRRVLPGETIVDTLGGEGHFILWTHVDQVVRHIEGLLTEAQ